MILVCSWVRTGHIFKCQQFMNYAILKAGGKNCKWKKSVLLCIAKWKAISIVRVTTRASVGINWVNVSKMHMTQRHSIKTITIKNIFKLLLYNQTNKKRSISPAHSRRETSKGIKQHPPCTLSVETGKPKQAHNPISLPVIDLPKVTTAFHC